MILVAIGANLPDRAGALPLATCRAGVEALRALPGLRLASVSPWYRTAPVPASEQPEFCNGVARLEGACDPEWLLHRLHAIEARAGRVRSVANAARVLDLDLIECNGALRDGSSAASYCCRSMTWPPTGSTRGSDAAPRPCWAIWGRA